MSRSRLFICALAVVVAIAVVARLPAAQAARALAPIEFVASSSDSDSSQSASAGVKGGSRSQSSRSQASSGTSQAKAPTKIVSQLLSESAAASAVLSVAAAAESSSSLAQSAPRGGVGRSLFSPPYDYSLLRDYMGRPLTHGGIATDKTTPSGLVASFLIDSRIKAGSDDDPNNPKPQRYVWAWYDKAGHRTNMVIEDHRRFEFNLESPPPFETAAVNLVYYALRVDTQLLKDIRFYGREYGYESALRRVQRNLGSSATLDPRVLTNHFAQIPKDWMGNRPLRDWLPSTQQRMFFRIILLGEKFPPRAELNSALEGALNVVVFMLRPTHLLQVWPPKNSPSAQLATQPPAAPPMDDPALRKWLEALKRDMEGRGRAAHLQLGSAPGPSSSGSATLKSREHSESTEESTEESSSASEESSGKSGIKGKTKAKGKAKAKSKGKSSASSESSAKSAGSKSKGKAKAKAKAKGKGGSGAAAAAKLIAGAIAKGAGGKGSSESSSASAESSSESSSVESANDRTAN